MFGSLQEKREFIGNLDASSLATGFIQIDRVRP